MIGDREDGGGIASDALAKVKDADFQLDSFLRGAVRFGATLVCGVVVAIAAVLALIR